MTCEGPYAKQGVKALLFLLLILLVLAASAVFEMTVAETSIATNGLATAILRVALLITFSAVFGILAYFDPSSLHKSLPVVLKIQLATWLSLALLELFEIWGIWNEENCYNSSFWGEDSGLSHGYSWADSGRYRDKGSYNKTCRLMKAKLSISLVVSILLYTIVFHFSFKLALIPDWKNGGRRLQAWSYKGRGVESRATEQEGGVAEQEGEATEKAIEGDSIAPIGKLVA